MKLVVDPPELHKASQKFNELAAEYNSVHNRLMDAARTMGDAWRAADNLAFVEQITGFCDDLKAMTEHIEIAAKALDQQAANYEANRDHNISSVKQLAN